MIGEQRADVDQFQRATVGCEWDLISRMLAQYGEPVRTCTEHDFSEPFLARAFEIINRRRANGQSVCASIVRAEIDTPDDQSSKALTAAESNGLTILRDEADLGTIVAKQASKRRAWAFAHEFDVMAMDPEQTPETLADRLAGMAEDLRNSTAPQLRTIRDVAMDIADDLLSESAPMSTGLPMLDDALAGGLWPGKLYGIQARMKVGKTVTAATLAWNVARSGQTPVLYVALEMGEDQIAQRMIASQMRINSLRFLDRRDRQATANLGDHVVNFAETTRAQLYFVDRPQMGFAGLQAAMHQHVRKAGVKLIVVDYWQLIRGKEAGQSQTEFLDNVAQWLADFAKAHKVAVLCPAQENRDGDCRFGDGLRMAASMYLRMDRADATGVDRIWMEMFDSRYTPIVDIGSEHNAPFWIDKRAGPVLREGFA